LRPEQGYSRVCFFFAWRIRAAGDVVFTLSRKGQIGGSEGVARLFFLGAERKKSLPEGGFLRIIEMRFFRSGAGSSGIFPLCSEKSGRNPAE